MAKSTKYNRLRVAAYRYLRKFGHDHFKPRQLSIILAILERQDVLAVLGTNAGKSLCYQIPALIFPAITVVITPHISLMAEQVENLNAAISGKKAAYINSTQTQAQIRKVLVGIRGGSIKLLYVSPGRLSNPEIQQVLRDVGISLLVVDECHCVVQDSTYRKDYLWISHYAKQLNVQQIAAFSATAPKGFLRDSIIDLVGLQNPKIFQGNLNRGNHFYDVRILPDNSSRNLELQSIMRELREKDLARGIIYCSRKEDIPHLLGFLKNWGIKATCYHGDLDNSQRQRNQQLFLSGERPVMVATKAFELGIDVSDVRFVIAYNIPASMSNLFQQWGRAGRDGKSAYCILLYAPQDPKLLKSFQSDNIKQLRGFRRELPPSVKSKLDLKEFKAHLKADHGEILRFVFKKEQCRRVGLLESQNRKIMPRFKKCCDGCEQKRRAGK